MIYKSNEIVEPFWAESSTNASGRDPLAIQNSSVVIYARMVVGITNVTNRIRYNGFYCWLIETILKNVEKRNSLDEQLLFIRRGELLLAYIMVEIFPEVTGVSGSFYAVKNRSPIISLPRGADWDISKANKDDLYWQFKAGVFGQYYSGVVQELGLIDHPGGELNIYTVTQRGKQLGAAFEENITKNASDLFWQSVLSGSIAEKDLSRLEAFALHAIPASSDENRFYEAMLLGADDRKQDTTYHRRNTIKLLLQFLAENRNGEGKLPLAFLKNNYLQHLGSDEIVDETATAWYLYEINELLHVAFEHFHACFLYRIETYPTPVQQQVALLIEDVRIEADLEGLDIDSTTLEQMAGVTIKSEVNTYNYFSEMEIHFSESSYGLCLLNAVRTLLSVWNDCMHQLTKLNAFAQQPEYHFDRPGFAFELLKELVDTKLNLTISKFIETLLFMAINRHTFSSYSKTKLGQSLVHNYLIEEDTVRRIRETLPNRTSPRLQNVIQYISDIGWLRKDTKGVFITDNGLQQIVTI